MQKWKETSVLTSTNKVMVIATCLKMSNSTVKEDTYFLSPTKRRGGWRDTNISKDHSCRFTEGCSSVKTPTFQTNLIPQSQKCIWKVCCLSLHLIRNINRSLDGAADLWPCYRKRWDKNRIFSQQTLKV